MNMLRFGARPVRLISACPHDGDIITEG